MFNLVYNVTASVYLAMADLKHKAVFLLHQLERGDADSSGSTLRTVGIVVMVVAMFAIIDAALGGMAVHVVKSIGSPSFK